MLRKICILILITTICFLLPSCRKCVKEERIEDTVIIIGSSYQHAMAHAVMAGKVCVSVEDPAKYATIVDYKGTEHKILERETYEAYKDKTNEKVKAIILVKSYDDGSVAYSIESLLK